MIETEIRLNKLLFSDRQNVTNSAQTLGTIFSLDTDVPNEITDRIKTIVITNNSANTVYFGADNTVSTANGGGIIYANTSREFPIQDINASPYFIASGNSEIGIEIWG